MTRGIAWGWERKDMRKKGLSPQGEKGRCFLAKEGLVDRSKEIETGGEGRSFLTIGKKNGLAPFGEREGAGPGEEKKGEGLVTKVHLTKKPGGTRPFFKSCK